MDQGRTQHVKGVISGLIRKWEQSTVKKGNAVLLAFNKAVNEKDRQNARPVSFKNGTLVILVKDASWLYKFTLEKKTILEKFNTKYTGRKKAQEIRFRIGELEHQ